jgi:hypothetical protein
VPSVAGAAVQAVPGIGTFNGLACISSSQCLGVGIVFASASSGAVGATAALTVPSGAGAGGQAGQTIPGTGTLAAVSCPSSTQCLAVGENADTSEGVAVPLDPATGAVMAGQSVQSISGISMAAVACPSPTLCLAVGHDPNGQGVAVPLDPSTGGIAPGESVQTIPGTGGQGLEGVACPTATECLVVGENAGRSAGVAVPLNPTTGVLLAGQSVQSVTTKGVLVGVSCPSATACLAVGWGADQPSVAVPLDPATGLVPSGQADQTISTRAAMLSAVSCPSVAQCLAVGNDDGDPSNGQAVPLNPITGAISNGQAIQSLSGTGALNAIACQSVTQCVVVGSGFGASGGVALVLSAATGSPTPTLVATPPPTTTSTTMATTPPPTTVVATGASALAPTGGNLFPLMVGGGVLVALGAALVGASLRRKRQGTATAQGEP